VHAGFVIGRLGNSGNSSEPHLHFQLCDGPSLINCEGLPFAIANFTRSKYSVDKNDAGQPALTIHATQHVSAEEPMEDELDSFNEK
jgi:murein DD-endopeptidase MepM/ murein hydrolase activator NlpD